MDLHRHDYPNDIHLHSSSAYLTTTTTTTIANEESTSTTMFCQSMDGGGMIMYMDGFRFALLGNGKNNTPCLNLLFPTWTLDTKYKFWLAIIGTFVFAFTVEGFSKIRHRLVRTAKQQCYGTSTTSAGSGTGTSANTIRTQTQTQPRTRPTEGFYTSSRTWKMTLIRLSITVLHGMQALCGYILMLVSMTFSVELLAAVVLGLAAGYGVFFNCTASINANTNTNTSTNTSTSTSTNNNNNNSNNNYNSNDSWNNSLMTTTTTTTETTETTNPTTTNTILCDVEEFNELVRHATNNPCCEFLEEEGKEIRIVLPPPPPPPIDATRAATAASVTAIMVGGNDKNNINKNHQQIIQQPQRFPNEV